MVKVLLFDLGGVLEKHRFKDLSLFIEKKYGVDSLLFYNFLIDKLRLNDCCKITDKQLIENINKKFHLKFTEKSFYVLYYKFIDSNFELLNFVKILKGKYTLAIFSNTRKKHLKESERRYSYSKIFDYVFISQNYCTRKPELKYYKLVLKTMHVKARDCIFIDDLERNLLPARKLGFHCILFKDVKHLKIALKK